jgi:hypothetical protein
LAWEGEARQALATFEQDVQATCWSASWLRATPRDGTRGRPRHGTPPAPWVDQRDGALAAALMTRPARSDQPRGVILATHARDTAHLPPPAGGAGDKGQGPVERGVRCLTDPPC